MKINHATKHVTCYLASGWFNEFQEECRQDILSALDQVDISYFSPKDEILVNPTASQEEQAKVFAADIEAILDCDFIIVNTAGKDLGTIFEAGYAYAHKKPIVYYFKAPKDVKFNMMLSHSGVAVAQNKEELVEILRKIVYSDCNFKSLPKYEGSVE